VVGDPLDPNQVRYQAALITDIVKNKCCFQRGRILPSWLGLVKPFFEKKSRSVTFTSSCM